MTTSWSEYLENKGVQMFSSGRITRNEPGLCDDINDSESVRLISCQHLAVFRCTGADAAEVLQGQFSCDIERINDNHWATGAYCNPKGRVLAILRIARSVDAFLLIGEASVLPSIIKRLNIYVLRADVNFTLDADTAVLGYSGNSITSPLGPIPAPATLGPGTAQAIAPGLMLRDHIATYRAMLVVPIVNAIALWEQLPKNVSRHNFGEWVVLDIRSGQTDIIEKNSGSFIPQTLNLDLVNAVSFDKGCYPGQEIVARVKYRSRPKHRMIRVSGLIGTRPCVGEAIYLETTSGNRAGEVIVAAQTARQDEQELLITIPVAALSRENYLLGSERLLLTRLPLPYAVEDTQAVRTTLPK